MGNYTISQLGSQNLTYSDPNYVINPTFNPGTLTITPAPLTITASNQTKTYGFDVANAGPACAGQ